jgi:thioredoxin-like negative regulator of GroEL
MAFEMSACETALKEAEAVLAISPRTVDSLFARARALDELGSVEAATRAYWDVLRIEPKHLGALTGLGAIAVKTGHRAAAKTAFTQAVEAHPHHAIGHTNLAILLCDEGDAVRAREHFETALRLEPGNRTAHRGLAILLLRLGETQEAQQHAGTRFAGQADAWPYRGVRPPVSVLLVLSAVGGNVPIDPFVDDRVFRKWTLTAEFFDPNAALPPHDVVFNGIGDADRCGPALDAAAAIVSHTGARVLNPPARVRETGRAANAHRLAQIPGVVTPRTAEWSRESLLAPEASGVLARAGFVWPLLLRSPGFHGGEHFVKVDGLQDLAQAVAKTPGSTLLVIQFLDTRLADGNFRKFRVMMVDGRLYPLHLAVSATWKVHYFSADMANRPEHRAEDEAFLRDMPSVLGPRATRALNQIHELLGLDYGGIDFAFDGQGNVVVFEANATMTVVVPGEEEQWRYRVAPVHRVQRAVHRMLLKAAGRPTEDAEGAPWGQSPADESLTIEGPARGPATDERVP